MAVDNAMLGPMLDPFRGMLADVEGKGMTGDAVDTMRATLARLDELGAQCADITEFNAKITTENLFMEFSDAYGKALSAGPEAQKLQDAAGDDDAMLANMLDAYRSAREQSGSVPDAESYLAALDEAIALGESGISFPVFLRKLEEEGLAAAMEGSTMTRGGIVRTIHFAADAHDPLALEKSVAYLKAFDDLAAKTRFNAPDNLAYTLAADRIDWEFEPREAEWAWVQDRWEVILSMVVDWLDAHAKFAPYDERWRTPGASEKQVKENIRRDKECLPGYLAERLRMFDENHGLGFDDIFGHASYANQYAANRIEWSDERIALLKETVPAMKPGAEAPAELVTRTESLHDSKAQTNPKLGTKVTLPVPDGVK